MTRTASILVLGLGQITLSGCVGSMSGLPGASSGMASVRGVFDPDAVLRNAEAVLLANQIPVQDVDRIRYRVVSGPFMVGLAWGGDPTEERVDCGTDSFGGPVARGGQIEMRVEVEISNRRGPTSFAQPSDGETVVDLTSRGEILWDQGVQGVMPRTASCRLAEPFARRLLEQMVGAPTGGSGGFGSASGELR